MVTKEKYEGSIRALYRRNEKFLAISAIIFFVSLFLGYFLSGIFSIFLDSTLQNFKKSIAQGDIQLNTLSLFTNNLKVVFFIYGGGALLGAFTVYLLFIQGSFIGYFATKVPLGDFILLTVPHGVFEIASIIIAGAAGFRLASFVYNFLDNILTETWYGSPTSKLKHVFWNNWDELKESLELLIISIVLLLVAAFIEANLTIAWAQYIKGFL
jgi:stage II sporulation protein M